MGWARCTGRAAEVRFTQVWPVGQPLRGAVPQPGTQKPPVPLQTRPESAAPHEVSLEHPQMPRSRRQLGSSALHKLVLVALHSPQAPARAPVLRQKGRSDWGSWARRPPCRRRRCAWWSSRAASPRRNRPAEAAGAHADPRRGVALRQGGRTMRGVGGGASGTGAAGQTDGRGGVAVRVARAGAAAVRARYRKPAWCRHTGRSDRQATQVAGGRVADRRGAAAAGGVGDRADAAGPGGLAGGERTAAVVVPGAAAAGVRGRCRRRRR